MIFKRIDIDPENNVYLNCYLHENPPIAFEEKMERPAVVVCPGGGYTHLSEREADPIALEYLAKGFNAFVLYYSLNEAAVFPKPIVDLSMALKIIRENADDWHIIKNQIAVCGFSAGGHVCACLGVHWKLPEVMEKSGCTNGENQPNALILCYPGITTRFWKGHGYDKFFGDRNPDEIKEMLDCNNHIGTHTPPAFLVHTFVDNCVPVNESLEFARVLDANDIPFELHVVPNGYHGMGLGNRETARYVDESFSKWMELSVLWLSRLFSDEKEEFNPENRARYTD